MYKILHVPASKYVSVLRPHPGVTGCILMYEELAFTKVNKSYWTIQKLMSLDEAELCITKLITKNKNIYISFSENDGWKVCKNFIREEFDIIEIKE